MKKRHESGCKGIIYIGISAAYLFSYLKYGIEGYVYFGVGVCLIAGLSLLVSAAFTDD